MNTSSVYTISTIISTSNIISTIAANTIATSSILFVSTIYASSIITPTFLSTNIFFLNISSVGVATQAGINIINVYGATNPALTVGSNVNQYSLQMSAASAVGNWSNSAVAGDAVFRNTVSSLVLQSGTAGAIHINTLNRVGIGASNATNLLTVGTNTTLPVSNSAGTTNAIVYGNVALYQNRMCFSNVTNTFNDTIYNNNQNLDGVGVFNGIKYNSNSGHYFNVGAVSGSTVPLSMYINSSGAVGIGTGTVNAPLHVYEAGTTPSATAGSVYLQHGDVGGKSSIVFKSSSDGNTYGYFAYNDSVTNPWGASMRTLQIGIGGTTGNRHLIFNPVGNNAFAPGGGITYFSGRVGIGTTTAWSEPAGLTSANVAVYGTIYIDSSLTVGNSNINSYYSAISVFKAPIITKPAYIVSTYVPPRTVNTYGSKLVCTHYSGYYARYFHGAVVYSCDTFGKAYFVSGTTTKPAYTKNVYHPAQYTNTPLSNVYSNNTRVYLESTSGTLSKLAINARGGPIVVTDTFYFNSDYRIKTNIRFALNLIEIVRQLRFVSYDYIESKQKCLVGLLAQEVYEIYPEAIQFTTDFIPNIYCTPSSIRLEDNIILLIFTSAIHVEKGDKLRYYVTHNNTKKEYTETVLSSDRYIICIPRWPDADPSDTVHVYGTEVNDFHQLDKTAIAMLGLGALKEIYGSTLEYSHTLNIIESNVEQLDATLATLQDQLATLQEKFAMRTAIVSA
jgi:hypothetical protein